MDCPVPFKNDGTDPAHLGSHTGCPEQDQPMGQIELLDKGRNKALCFSHILSLPRESFDSGEALLPNSLDG